MDLLQQRSREWIDRVGQNCHTTQLGQLSRNKSSSCYLGTPQHHRSDELHGSVVVAMLAVRMMQTAAYEVIDVVAMRHRLVTAVRTVFVRAARLGRALHGVGGADGDDMFVDMVLMHVVEMAVVKIVHVVFVAYRGVTTVRAVLMGMIGMVQFGASAHNFSFIDDHGDQLSIRHQVGSGV
jgi:hypothetical protein